MKKTCWTAPTLQDFNISLRKRVKVSCSTNEPFEINKPKCISELAINSRKIAEVQKWIAESIFVQCPILLLCGPSGSGKSTTLKLVAEAENLFISEWVTPVSKTIINNFIEENDGDKNAFFDISESKKFEEFVTRSSRYPSLFQPKKRTIILVKDIPNTFIWTPEIFHSFLEKYKSFGKSPIVFILTDGENLDLHNSLFPNSIKLKLGISVIKFNPVSDTLLKKNFKNLTNKCNNYNNSLTSEYLENIVKNCCGDLRSAVTDITVALKTGETNPPVKKRKQKAHCEKEKVLNTKPLPSRDRYYDFYKKMGRVLYPKRVLQPKESNIMNGNFVHSVLEIAENWNRSHQSFLHENYLQTCTKLTDAATSAEYFSFCDVLAPHIEMEKYINLVTVAGLMTANTEPKKTGFLPFKKSVNVDVMKESKFSYKDTCIIRFGVDQRVFALDVAPLSNWLSVDSSFCTRTLIPFLNNSLRSVISLAECKLTKSNCNNKTEVVVTNSSGEEEENIDIDEISD